MSEQDGGREKQAREPTRESMHAQAPSSRDFWEVFRGARAPFHRLGFFEPLSKPSSITPKQTPHTVLFSALDNPSFPYSPHLLPGGRSPWFRFRSLSVDSLVSVLAYCRPPSQNEWWRRCWAYVCQVPKWMYHWAAIQKWLLSTTMPGESGTASKCEHDSKSDPVWPQMGQTTLAT